MLILLLILYKLLIYTFLTNVIERRSFPFKPFGPGFLNKQDIVLIFLSYRLDVAFTIYITINVKNNMILEQVMHHNIFNNNLYNLQNIIKTF